MTGSRTRTSGPGRPDGLGGQREHPGAPAEPSPRSDGAPRAAGPGDHRGAARRRVREEVASRRARALVYRGPAALPGCPEAVASLLSGSRWDLDVHYVGPGGDLPLRPEVLAGAALYAQPGGGTLAAGWRRMRKHRNPLRHWVAGGGRYLGFCLGAYLAGATPGLRLLPGDTDQYIASPDATVHTESDTLVEVDWRGTRRQMFFQDGATFQLRPGAEGVDVIARYPNAEIAALSAPYGAGRVAVVGPHPEASDDWFDDAGLPHPGGPDGDGARDLARDLVDAVMR